MHGRLKVKTTEEQQEAKRKEREKKLKVYTAATAKIFEKRTNQLYDEEGLKLSGEILGVNSDFSTLWNFRKEVFHHFKETRDAEELQKLFDDELYFLECCLKGNPKSYGTWHHRCFILENMNQPNWKRELELCNKFLEYDERNFHCWDYRRFVVKKSNVSPESELEYTTKKIANNFSNYSSWHYRSKLLPIIYPDPVHPVGVQESILLQEYETVQNAFFTDPDDQSSWFYHRWLLGRGRRDLDIRGVYVSRGDKRIFVQLTKPIMVSQASNFSIKVNHDVIENVQTSPVQTFHSELWIFGVHNIPVGDVTIEIGLKTELGEKCSTILIEEKRDESWIVRKQAKDRTFSYELSAATKDTLTRELQSIQELLDLEPDNKWAILTVVSLMRAIDPLQYSNQVFEYLDKLIEIDSKRTLYYKDMKSKYSIENAIEEFSEESRCLDLSSQCLSTLYHFEYLFTVKEINLSNNELCHTKDLMFMPCLEKIDLTCNKLEKLDGLEELMKLKELIVANNNINSVNVFNSLRECKQLKKIDVTGNPVCKSENFEEIARNILPNVENFMWR